MTMKIPIMIVLLVLVSCNYDEIKITKKIEDNEQTKLTDESPAGETKSTLQDNRPNVTPINQRWQPTTRPTNESGKIKLFAFSKALFHDDLAQQNRATVAVDKVVTAASIRPNMLIEKMQEKEMTTQEYLNNNQVEVINKKIMLDKFSQYQASLTAEDSFIVYSHTHGRKSSDDLQGGIIIGMKREVITWEEYAEVLLNLPAKNIIVFTMACFSGGLIDYLNRPEVRERWVNRNRAGRSFMVISSTNADLLSMPVRIDGGPLNPLTYSVANAFLGSADGYAGDIADDKLSYEEIAHYVLDNTEGIMPDQNINLPQSVQSFTDTARF